jgi:hypothetical protein
MQRNRHVLGGKTKERRLTQDPGLLGGFYVACPEQIAVLAKKVMIGHAGDVVAYNSILGVALRQLGVGSRHRFGMVDVKIEELSEGLHGALAIANDGRLVIQSLKQEFLEESVLGGYGRAESQETVWLLADVLDALDA